ncbi:MAG TPA: amidohydrolase family protein, partial [Bacilli bacterium]
YEASGTQNGGTYQAFPLFLEKTKEHKFNLEDTIHKMTGATADRFKIPNRGYIKEGYAADITIFNFDEISVNKEDPGETPKGIKYVIVNGQVVLANNEYQNIKNGRLITKTRSN